MQAMAAPEETDHGPDDVTVTENMGEWFVRVVIDGNAHVSTFD